MQQKLASSPSSASGRYKSLRVQLGTWMDLQKLGHKGESFDDILRNLIDFYLKISSNANNALPALGPPSSTPQKQETIPQVIHQQQLPQTSTVPMMHEVQQPPSSTPTVQKLPPASPPQPEEDEVPSKPRGRRPRKTEQQQQPKKKRGRPVASTKKKISNVRKKRT